MFRQNDFESFADALEDVGAPASIATQVEEAIAAFAGFGNKDWLEWGERIMPELAARVAEEKREAMLDAARARAAAFDEAAAATKARRLAAANKRAHEQKLLSKEDLLAKRIVKEEYARRIGLVDIELAQRISAIEAGEESEGDGLESEERDPILTQASVSSLLEVPVPAKRKSDDELLDLREVHGKVSAIGITVAYHN